MNASSEKAKTNSDGKQVDFLKSTMIFNRKLYVAGTDIKELPEGLVKIARKQKLIERKKL